MNFQEIEMTINSGQLNPERRYFSTNASGNFRPEEDWRERESYYMRTSRWVELGRPGKILVTVQAAGDVDYEVREEKLQFVELKQPTAQTMN